ncbi:ARM repeat superfamily protein [Melia azedarach]|uniref:ARM repeat superfamily protein n=1 Tax=Melia azedarach TaxID=155640 RepID=A0ACC1X3N5_MELAZ|nr:ARM repeat superfamily protein [Melia azedarach]
MEEGEFDKVDCSFNDELSEAEKSSTFSELKAYGIELLQILQNPNKNSSSLTSFLNFLQNSPPESLQPFFDYTLFPLLLLLDAAVECRSSSKEERKTNCKVSDRVAEGVIKCLEQLLSKCFLGSVDQMVVVMKKLTYGALLSPPEASEEFREGVIKCFRAMLLSLRLCSDNLCSCKQVLGLPELLERKIQQTSVPGASESGECLVAFLQSQDASAAVGHWLSLLLKAADTEAARGHRGSGKLRVEAFLTLRILVAKVGTADSLAFFLPGVVSQFAKVLHVSKTILSGAAGSVEAIDQAIRGLAEYLMIVLQDDVNLSGLDMPKNVTAGNDSENYECTSLLEELRQLPIKVQGQSTIVKEYNSGEPVNMLTSKSGFKDQYADSGKGIGSLLVARTKDWIEKTSSNVNKLLCATFPHKVREGLLAAIRGLLSKCSYTLKESRLMLLECLCVLVVDDYEEISAVAQAFLEYLLLFSGKQHVKLDVTDIFTRLIEKLPKLVLGSEESLALSHAQKLLVVMYYSGPQFVLDQLQSPVTAARFLDAFALCLSWNSGFTGSLDKLILARPSSAGFLHSIAELRAGAHLTDYDQTFISSVPSGISKLADVQQKITQCPQETVQKMYELPRMPPWFVSVGSQKLYQALAGTLRLVGLSLMPDFESEGRLSVITDIPLGYLHKLVAEVRAREYNKESWQSWYNRTGLGQLLHQASTAACIINEMIFGLSDEAVDTISTMFQKSRIVREIFRVSDAESIDIQSYNFNESIWKVKLKKGVKSHLIDCVGKIMHEYVSSEVWDLPVDRQSSLIQYDEEVEDVTLHFFCDTAMLHQIIINGIGIFALCLGKDFASSGFLHSSLYLLLENLISSNSQVRSASDAVLHVLSAISGYPMVGHLVLANADYVIDSICRQLRHLDLNPHVPNVLAAMLSYIGVANKILPLLEEPMRSVSQELEILGRHQHPDLTISFLKAVAEIVKASKHEASTLPSQAESYLMHVKSKISYTGDKAKTKSKQGSGSCYEQWESILFNLNDSKRYRRMVGSIAGSCLTTATALLASEKQAACLVALDIVEDGITTLAKVEEAYRHERAAKEAIEEELCSSSLYHLQDNLEAAEDGTDENRLLPAVNKLWPFLVICVRSKNPVAVRRCLSVISSVVQFCGGDFFSRRFHTDGPHFWKLLSTSQFQKKPKLKEEKAPLLLPYRSTSISSEDSLAEVSNLKVQVALLNMIADLSRNKKSASALDAVLKKVSGLVVGIACSGVIGLRDASINALCGLESIDPDLIWLLLADVYYSLEKTDLPSPPTLDFPEVLEILPPCMSSKEYLYVQYGGQSFGFDVDFSSVETVFKKLHAQVFTNQMYS